MQPFIMPLNSVHNMTQHIVIWYTMIQKSWYEMIQCHMIQHNTTQYDTICYALWHYMTQCDTKHSTIWYNMIPYHIIRCNTIWYDILQYSMWYSMIGYNTSNKSSKLNHKIHSSSMSSRTQILLLCHLTSSVVPFIITVIAIGFCKGFTSA